LEDESHIVLFLETELRSLGNKPISIGVVKRGSVKELCVLLLLFGLEHWEIVLDKRWWWELENR
jgi:hypothetical protein